MAFHCFITPPVEAKKKYLTLKELKVCAQESIALSSLWEEYEKAKRWSDLQYKNAEKLYNDTEIKKNELNNMNAQSQKEIDRRNELIDMINEQTELQPKANKKSKSAAAKQNILKAKFDRKRAVYIDNCTNILFKKKHIFRVCGKVGKYKDTDFCKDK